MDQPAPGRERCLVRLGGDPPRRDRRRRRASQSSYAAAERREVPDPPDHRRGVAVVAAVNSSARDRLGGEQRVELGRRPGGYPGRVVDRAVPEVARARPAPAPAAIGRGSARRRTRCQRPSHGFVAGAVDPGARLVQPHEPLARSAHSPGRPESATAASQSCRTIRETAVRTAGAAMPERAETTDQSGHRRRAASADEMVAVEVEQRRSCLHIVSMRRGFAANDHGKGLCRNDSSWTGSSFDIAPPAT